MRIPFSARVSRKQLVMRAAISVLVSIGIILLSMLPMIGDRTGFAGFYMMFGLFAMPWIVLGTICASAFGRLRDIGLSPVIAVVPLVVSTRTMGPLAIEAWMQPLVLVLPLVLLRSDALRLPRLVDVRTPMALLTGAFVAMLVVMVAQWIGYRAMPPFIDKAAVFVFVVASVWLAWASGRKAEEAAGPVSFDVLTEFIENAFRGTPWVLISGVSMAVAILLHLHTGRGHVLFLIIEALPTAFLIGLVLAPLHQLLVRRRIGAGTVVVLALLPFLHWSLTKVASNIPEEVSIHVASIAPAFERVETLLTETRHTNGNMLPDFMMLLNVDHLVVRQDDGGYRGYHNDRRTLEAPPVVPLEKAMEGRTAVVFDRTRLDDGSFHVEVRFRNRDGEEQLLATRTWRPRQGTPLLDVPVVGRFGWERDIFDQQVDHEREAMNDALGLLGIGH